MKIFIFFLSLYLSFFTSKSLITAEIKNTPASPIKEFQVSSMNLPETIEIYKSDRTLQCSDNPGISFETMLKTLEQNSITVLNRNEPEKRTLCGLRASMCGITTGKVNIYKIYTQDLEKVEMLGFKKWTHCN